MYKNSTHIPLSLAVWLAHDDYDHNPDKSHISVTTLIKSLKQIILSTRVISSAAIEDITNLVQARMGTAIHNSIESAWKSGDLYETLTGLGYSDDIAARIEINPTKEELEKRPDIIPVYMEQRNSRTVDGINISGKFDFISEGVLEDFKSTGTYTYINKSNDAKYALQGSIYKWLNPDIITANYMVIQYIFTDWKAVQALSNRDYPQTRTLAYKVPLMSIEQTNAYVMNKVACIKVHMNDEESRLPACTDEDLWRRAPVWKYYKNPAKTTRSTKNFTSMTEANIRLASDGNVGKVVEVKGEVVACRYCNASSVCQQKDTYIANGTLTL